MILGRSKQLTILLTSLFSLTVCLLWILCFRSTLPGWLTLLATLYCFYLGYHCLRMQAQKNARHAICKLQLNMADVWILFDNQGQRYQATLLPNSLFTLYFILLNFKLQGRRRAVSVLIFPDHISQQERHDLSVYLNFFKEAQKLSQ